MERNKVLWGSRKERVKISKKLRMSLSSAKWKARRRIITKYLKKKESKKKKKSS